MVWVFPDHAQALMRRGQLIVSTASLCCGLRFDMRHSIEKRGIKSRKILAFRFFSDILAVKSLFFHTLDLVKLFGSRSRVKLLEKLVIEDTVSHNSNGFFIRELCRDTDEQINAVRRELMNLEALTILKSYEQNKKKYYMMNHNCAIYHEIVEMFLKSYNILVPVKEFFK